MSLDNSPGETCRMLPNVMHMKSKFSFFLARIIFSDIEIIVFLFDFLFYFLFFIFFIFFLLTFSISHFLPFSVAVIVGAKWKMESG
ncbi:hypothetical protein BDQ94DRAFT_147517 [Aspergillus welwitschiae]|uniref:Uncharacterized protein n=1 Tax=Aspergillus welwitschiae TaxID=1341132 RepID=A0A3F3PW16_9EURO|nr:hypothetical protein BDQ94DRAFT_147517 [Aspergillus welwitschiae]RDH31131.1 hypothetical protein BDQ94DRAFT_147517 [Aspergillus welwitschiae]